MKKYVKKMIPLMVMGLAFSFNVSIDNVESAVVEASSQDMVLDVKGAIDWTKEDESNVTAIGVGVPNPAMTEVQGKVMARRAAIIDAQRQLLEIIKGINVDGESLMSEAMIKSDVVKTKINGLLYGARIIDEGPNPDGSYVVKMGVPLYGTSGSVAAAVIPEVMKDVEKEAVLQVTETTLAPQAVAEVKQVQYTGVVVDATGLGLEPTFSPVIYDTNGRIIYGIKNLDKDVAISKGVVAYANEIGKATHGNRAGDNPLVVKAVDVRGGANSVNKVNVVVSVEDADRILIANESAKMLEGSAVVFVK